MTLADRLRRAMRAPCPPQPLPGDGLVFGDPDAPPVPAAVLVAITDRPEPGVLLTVRTAGLRNHGGQVAFPGGRIDPDDADAEAAALREAEEEIALPSTQVTVVGRDEAYRTVTGFSVTPVVGVVPANLALAPAEAEVAALFEAPLAHLLDPANVVIRAMEWRGTAREYREILWEDQRIWGATAAILVNLSRRLRWTG